MWQHGLSATPAVVEAMHAVCHQQHTCAVEAMCAVHDDVVIGAVQHHALNFKDSCVHRKRVRRLVVALACYLQQTAARLH